MEFNFKSTGKILYGIPYVAKIKSKGKELKKEFMKCSPSISKFGEVSTEITYEAENFEIVEERYGAGAQVQNCFYNLVYKNKLITLGPATNNEELENRILKFLNNELSVIELLSEVDEVIKKEYEKEILEIFNEFKDKKTNNKSKQINIINAVKEFIEINELIQVTFNDFHIIFNSEIEEVLMSFNNENMIYIETKSMKININLDRIKDYNVTTEEDRFIIIEIVMNDEATIKLTTL